MKLSKLQTNYCQLEGITVAYTEHGQGEKLLLLHANSSSKHFWTKRMQDEYKDFHTIAIDSRFHGQTEASGDDITYEMMGEDTIKFIEKMNFQNCTVIGYSDGAIIALYLASVRPDLFKSYISISPNLNYQDITDKWKKNIKMLCKYLRFLNTIGLVKKRIIIRCEMMLMETYLNVKSLNSITKDLHIIYGDSDICSDSHFEQMKAWIPQARFTKITNATHGNMLKHEDVLRTIREDLHT